MKKYKYILPLLFGAVALFTACSEDRLDIPQKGVVSIESFYKTDADAQSALVAAYDKFATNMASWEGAYIYVPYNILFNYGADNILAAGEMYGDNDMVAAINEYRFDTQSPVVRLAYNHFYYVIYSANLVIDHFKYGESPIKDRCISEARVLRAWCHMMAAMAFDCPPLIDHVLVGSDKPTNYEGGHDALLQWCADECADAVQYLDERKSTTDKDGAVKITKGFAWTVQGKALLYKGDYANAKKAFKNIISSGKYDLVPGEQWADLFHIDGDGSEEKIFESNIAENASISDWSGKINRSTWMEMNIWGWRSSRLAAQPIYMAQQGWGGLAIEGSFAKEFAANDGDSYRRKGTMLTYDEFITELEWPSDKGDINSMTKEQKFADSGRGIKNVDGLYGQCEYLQKKHIAIPKDILNTSSYRYNNYIVARYADILLLYAETCAQTSDNDGLQYLQKVQQRAGSQHISSTLTLDEVKKERNYELWCEGARWIDMKRWGELEKVKNAGKHIPSLKDAYFTLGEPNHRGYVEYSEPNADKQTGFKAGKHEYFPYPFSVTSINPNMKQNPGWE
ncbi:MAG TPA: RagB/SusD family nutrient uptake outer membrane protein [Prolixibacteraceae bacterium]|nr:RagB/SusD family nutrient uptake outer membrane protein [Prolixibacteraceae bacterium]